MTTLIGHSTEDIETWSRNVTAELPKVRDRIERAVAWLADHPEPGGEEVETAAFLCAQLETVGFDVKRGVAGLPTAFTASSSADSPGGNVGLVVVYDAVPVVDLSGESAADHSCGHLAIAAGAIAVAEIWQRLRGSAHGSLTILGCPADEHATDISRTAGGGKAALEAAGLLSDLDAVLYVHPEDRNTVLRQTQCSVRFRGTLSGQRSPGALPDLLAQMARFGAEAEFKENRAAAYLERVTTVGDAADGATIVVSGDLMVRAHTQEELSEAIERVKTQSGDISWREMARYDGLKPHKDLIEGIEAVFETMGMNYDGDPPLIPYATDFGRMTTTIPGALIGLGNHHWDFHTPECSAAFLEEAVPQAEEYARVTSVLVPVIASLAPQWK